MNKDIFEEIANKFRNTKDQNGEILKIDYLLIMQNDQVFNQKFKKENTPSDIRSISKTVMTMVTGIVIDLSKQGKYPEFNYETSVYPILKKIFRLRNTENIEKLKKLKVKHLLNHTIGFDHVLMMRDDIINRDPFTYVDYILNEPIKYNPGEHYLYSNAGFYLLSALLQEFLQEDLLKFIDRHLFNPLDIKNYKWEKYGNYLAGATRLWLLPQDLLKIGQVLLTNGMYGSERIITENQIKKMLISTHLTPKLDTPGSLYTRHSYASGIWLSDNSIFFGHGTDGQCLVMIPEKNAIIITLARQNKVRELEGLVNEIITKYL